MNTTAPNPQSNIHTEPADETRPDGSSDARPAWAGPDLADGLKSLRRPVDGRLIGGVAAGIAKYLGADISIVRIVFVVLAFAGGAALPLYVAGWLLIPEEGSDQSIVAELFGSMENRSR
ncbi:MAG TPA: PspC domain-containing protein [Streptosporangiaceae bacterium]|nr:PspC domain-containing protein [Streptosporangiaceae bacterium]